MNSEFNHDPGLTVINSRCMFSTISQLSGKTPYTDFVYYPSDGPLEHRRSK